MRQCPRRLAQESLSLMREADASRSVQHAKIVSPSQRRAENPSINAAAKRCPRENSTQEGLTDRALIHRLPFFIPAFGVQMAPAVPIHVPLVPSRTTATAR